MSSFVPRLPFVAHLVGALGVACAGSLLFAAEGDEDELFEARIRPVLDATCYECHSAAKQKSGLRLDSWLGMTSGGERGPAVVPGAPDESLLVRAIGWEDHDLQMPPRERLDEAVVADFARWIEAGAGVPDDFLQPRAASEETAAAFDLEERLRHWSFQPIRSVEPPTAAVPERVANPVDAFLEAGLEQAGVTPNPRAERATLLRRVTFGLTGLPPTTGELEAFLGDAAPDAFERVVDRLLASPAYGEHWTRHWLDLMRYAESRGHEFDYDIPNAWQYRDYVVRALQEDVPYDRFVLEHIAGDLLEEPRPNRDGGWDESILGTGSWYLGEEVHSPVDLRGDQVERVANQVDVVTKAFLGLTVACARCHDHKFDAIPTEDYYAMAGFALSSSARQVRFESREANARVARELARAEAQHAPAVARAYGEAWAAAAEDVVQLLDVARTVARATPEEYPSLPPRTDVLVDVVVEDFEGEDWGQWTVEGDAFGLQPARVVDTPDYMGDVNAVGRGWVNSHAPGLTDERTGAITSAPFELTRRYLRFRVGGGDHLGRTGVELWLLEPDGSWKLGVTRTGINANRMIEASWDLRAWAGRTARVRVFDDVTDGWGNIGVDHLVLSEEAEDDATRAAREMETRRVLHLAAVCEREGVDLVRARAGLELVDRARDRAHDPLHALSTGEARTAAGGRSTEGEGDRDGDKLLVLADWGALSSASEVPSWIVDGPSFGVGPRATGAVVLGASPWRPLARVVALAGPHADPAWDGLALAPGTEEMHTKLNWTQSGRTIRTATFVLPEAPLWYLVDGAVDVFVEVDGYRMIKGPLYDAFVLRAGDQGLRWVRQDTSEFAGHRAHVEFTARAGRGPGEVAFALHAVVASEVEPSLPNAGDDEVAEVLAQISEGADGRAATVSALRAAALALAHGTLDAEGARLADWMARHPQLLPAAVIAEGRFDTAFATAFAPWAEARATATRDARMLSRTAPAILDGSGVDEYVLIRGSHRTPGDFAPRRAPIGVAGQMQATMGPGSGRLELARRMVAPENPFLARVQVNRVWHHLFGRGLVPTVDNLGLLGDDPTHPELLDWLATWYRQEGWSTKRLVKLLVMSEAYCRSSAARPDLADVDGGNRLWHRAFVRRISGEALRDAILATTGELDLKSFGPPIPVHLTDFLQGRGRPANSGPVDGEGRRSLYLSVRRNFPHAFFAVFDQPNAATTVGRRSRSNVPAQALSLLNDPFLHEQSEAWAQRLVELGDPPEGRVERMFMQAYGRPVRGEERAAALEFVRAEAARRRLAEGDAGVWADLAHVLLNGKELCFLR